MENNPLKVVFTAVIIFCVLSAIGIIAMLLIEWLSNLLLGF